MGQNASRRTQSLLAPVIESAIHETQIESVYILGKVIGSGNYGVVREAYPIGSNSKVAIKIIQKSSNLSKDRLKKLNREVEILKIVSHPNIIRFYDAYEDTNIISIVTEYCSGGELGQKIIKIGHFTESQSRPLVHQILMAINYLHNNRIVHRDIKPENFLLESQKGDFEIKLIDFGFAKKFRNLKHLHSVSGTSYYIAPEVLRGSYNYKCDLWSAGIIMYQILCGQLPFYSRRLSEAFKKIKIGRFDKECDSWKAISHAGRDLIKKLICMNPSSRLSAKEALDHDWLSTSISHEPFIDNALLKSFQEYSKISLFKKELLNILVKHSNLSQIKDLDQIFLNLDDEHKGEISAKLLKETMQKSGFQLSIQEIKELIRAIDVDQTGKITYSEFLAAAISSKHHLQKEEVLALFNHFDVERKGFITSEDIKTAIHRSGDVLEQKIKKMLKEIGMTKANKIYFNDFVCLLNN
ncbi:unnamed protein product [Blepharisma stoltei]|uniref:non-specific serine/threonine protein kinase n=1 Tax=Blepharisma stoltei TaxID=1481888 RepID=A0AAU9J1V0_9CILI|nr:unnamed protein product [Blepharisma stoltei]